MTKLSSAAYGKLNLTLDVCGRRADGYHDLQMVMVSVALADEVSIRFGSALTSGVKCFSESLNTVFPQNEHNLCWKAADVYFKRAGVRRDNLDISVRKRIPSEAGMAGGSSDAAAVLRILNAYYGFFNDLELHEIALSVGSDVPYCLSGGCALAEGRGEILTPLPHVPDEFYAVIVRPDFSVSTPELFRRIDSFNISRRPDIGAMKAALHDASAENIGLQLCNVFSPCVAALHPEIETVKDRLKRLGAYGAEMTGTGSVVYGVFSNRAMAETAADMLRESYSFSVCSAFVREPAEIISIE